MDVDELRAERLLVIAVAGWGKVLARAELDGDERAAGMARAALDDLLAG